VRVSLLLLLLLLSATASAQPCAPLCIRPAVQTLPAVVTPVVERVRYVDEAQVLVFVPTFTVSYQPPLPYPPGIGGQLPGGYGAAPPPQVQQAPPVGLADCLAAIKQLNARLDGIEQRLGGVSPLPQRFPIPPADPTPPGPPVPAKSRASIIRAKCAQCHTAGKLQEDTTFVMVDDKGGIVTLAPEQEIKVGRKCYSGEMPPKTNKLGIAPLTDEETKYMLFPEGGVK